MESQTFPQFLADFRAGKPGKIYGSTAGRTLERAPPIRRDLIQRRRYLVPNSILVTRGCPQHCDFCYKDAFFEGGRGFYTQRVDGDALDDAPAGGGTGAREPNQAGHAEPSTGTPEYPSGVVAGPGPGAGVKTPFGSSQPVTLPLHFYRSVV